MAIKFAIKTLDEVDEKYRDLYVEKKDDKGTVTGFQLQVDGVRTQADVDAVTKAKQRETEEHGKTKTKLKDTEAKLLVWEELDPEDVKAKLDKLTTLEAGNSQTDLQKNFETTVAARAEQLAEKRIKIETAKLAKQIGELQTANAAYETNAKTLSEQIRHRTIDDAVRGAATTAKVQEFAVPDALIHARGVFKIDEAGKIVTEDGKDPAEWMEDRKAISPHWWPVAKGAGAHGSGDGTPFAGSNPWTPEAWSVTEQTNLVRTNATKATQLAEQANSHLGATSPTGHAWNPVKKAWVKL